MVRIAGEGRPWNPGAITGGRAGISGQQRPAGGGGNGELVTAEVLAQRQAEEAHPPWNGNAVDEIVRKMAENKPDLPDGKNRAGCQEIVVKELDRTVTSERETAPSGECTAGITTGSIGSGPGGCSGKTSCRSVCSRWSGIWFVTCRKKTRRRDWYRKINAWWQRITRTRHVTIHWLPGPIPGCSRCWSGHPDSGISSVKRWHSVLMVLDHAKPYSASDQTWMFLAGRGAFSAFCPGGLNLSRHAHIRQPAINRLGWAVFHSSGISLPASVRRGEYPVCLCSGGHRCWRGKTLNGWRTAAAISWWHSVGLCPAPVTALPGCWCWRSVTDDRAEDRTERLALGCMPGWPWFRHLTCLPACGGCNRLAGWRCWTVGLMSCRKIITLLWPGDFSRRSMPPSSGCAGAFWRCEGVVSWPQEDDSSEAEHSMTERQKRPVPTPKREDRGNSARPQPENYHHVTTPPKWKVKSRSWPRKRPWKQSWRQKRRPDRRCPFIWTCPHWMRPWISQSSCGRGLFDGDTPRLLACGIRYVLLEDISREEYPASHKTGAGAGRPHYPFRKLSLAQWKAGACRYDTHGYVTEHISGGGSLHAAESVWRKSAASTG